MTKPALVKDKWEAEELKVFEERHTDRKSTGNIQMGKLSYSVTSEEEKDLGRR